MTRGMCGVECGVWGGECGAGSVGCEVIERDDFAAPSLER